MDIFSIIFYQPVYNLLVLFYRMFGENLGIAIILVGLLTRIIILPFTLKQIKFAEDAKKMSEEIALIRKTYKDQKEKMQEEIMKIQSKYLPGQLSGCLPLILQFIFLINIYHVISDIVQKGAQSFNVVAYPFIPKFAEDYILNDSFVGVINLTKSYSTISQIEGISFSIVLAYILLIIFVGLTQYLSIKLSNNSISITKEDNLHDKRKSKESNPDEDLKIAMQKTQSQLAFLFPIMISLISLSFPSGLVLYWIVQNVFVIIQQILFKNLKKH